MSERIVIVGPGRMGLAVGAALHESGDVERVTFFGRAMEPPPHPLFETMQESGAPGYRMLPSALPADTSIVLLAVPDRAIPEVAYDLTRMGPTPSACTVLHLSGAISTDVLSPLHAVGYAVGSIHPLQAIADPWISGDRLIGSAFAIAGEPAAVNAARRLVQALQGLALVIPPSLRPVYHAAAVMVSNYTIALVGMGARLLMEAGVPEKDAVPALLPLLRGTVSNLEHLGIPAALTGPIPRGDTDTIRLHLARLSDRDRVLYCGLGLEMLDLARGAGLNADRAAEIEALLSRD
ncbi:MAG: Rossmann-like and DUF2520 domain-containing protein [Longimicrobiales bacterium]